MVYIALKHISCKQWITIISKEKKCRFFFLAQRLQRCVVITKHFFWVWHRHLDAVQVCYTANECRWLNRVNMSATSWSSLAYFCISCKALLPHNINTNILSPKGKGLVLDDAALRCPEKLHHLYCFVWFSLSKFESAPKKNMVKKIIAYLLFGKQVFCDFRF